MQGRRQRLSNCVEKYLALSLNGPHGQITMNGSSVTRRFPGVDRTVFVLSTRTRCSESDIQLREDCWLIVNTVRSTSADLRPMTRVQQFYRVHVDQSSGQQASPETQELQELVLKAAGDRVQNHQRLMQQALIKEFGSEHHPSSQGIQAAPREFTAVV